MLYYYWCVVFLSFHFNFSENGQKKPKNKLSLKNFEEPTVVGSVASKRLHAGRWSIPVVSHF